MKSVLDGSAVVEFEPGLATAVFHGATGECAHVKLAYTPKHWPVGLILKALNAAADFKPELGATCVNP